MARLDVRASAMGKSANAWYRPEGRPGRPYQQVVQRLEQLGWPAGPQRGGAHDTTVASKQADRGRSPFRKQKHSQRSHASGGVRGEIEPESLLCRHKVLSPTRTNVPGAVTGAAYVRAVPTPTAPSHCVPINHYTVRPGQPRELEHNRRTLTARIASLDFCCVVNPSAGELLNRGQTYCSCFPVWAATPPHDGAGATALRPSTRTRSRQTRATFPVARTEEPLPLLRSGQRADSSAPSNNPFLNRTFQRRAKTTHYSLSCPEAST